MVRAALHLHLSVRYQRGTPHQHSHVIAGSQYTQLIARRIRELGMFSVLFPGDASLVCFFYTQPVIYNRSHSKSA